MFLILLITLFFSSNPANAETYYWKVKKVVDGDTIEVEAPFLPKELKLSIRVIGIDTPEKAPRAKCKKEAELGEKATKMTKLLLSSAQDIGFSEIKWDKFGGRIDAKVSVDRVDLGESLISAGLARPYHGEKKQSWCK